MSVLCVLPLQQVPASSSSVSSCVRSTASNECGNYGEIIYSANIYLPCGYQSPPESYANLSTGMDLTGVHIFSLSGVCFGCSLGDCNAAYGRTDAGQLMYWIGLINCTSVFFSEIVQHCRYDRDVTLNYSPRIASIGMTFDTGRANLAVQIRTKPVQTPKKGRLYLWSAI